MPDDVDAPAEPDPLLELADAVRRLSARLEPDDEDNPHVRRRRIVDLIDQGNLSLAEGAIRELLDKQWKVPENIYLFGITLLLQGRLAEARRAIDQALDQKPWLTEVASWHGQLRACIDAAVDGAPDWVWPRYRQQVDRFTTFGLTLTSALSSEYERSDVQLVQVGANDGVGTDPMRGWIEKFGWNGLLLEPMDEPYASLATLYDGSVNVTTAQCAISDRDGTRTMWTDADGRHAVSTFLPDRNILRNAREVVPQPVRCATFETVLAEHGIDSVDILQIDTEGYDYQVARLFPFDTHRPALIHLEFYLLPIAERLELFDLVDRHGYGWRMLGADLLVVDRERFGARFGLIDVTG